MNKEHGGEGLPLVLYGPLYDESIGGSLVIHKLCHLINSLGRQASVFPGFFCQEFREARTLRAFGGCFLCRWRWLLKQFLGYRLQRPRHLHAPYSRRLPRDFVAIYPEIVAGNPLRAPVVVRWLLHRPGFFTGETELGETDLLLTYAQHFGEGSPADVPHLELRCQILKTDIFREPEPAAPRSGSCYILRKGRGRRMVHDMADSICVDDMSDQQMAEVFSRVKVCYSYDPYTMLSRYAALCGCLSVVVPEEGVDRLAWRPREADRYGIAYGVDDAAWARSTLGALREEMERIEAQSVEQTRQFLRAVDAIVARKQGLPGAAAWKDRAAR